MIYASMYNYWLSKNIETYYKMRYGPSWRWYYLNWEENGEFIP